MPLAKPIWRISAAAAVLAAIVGVSACGDAPQAVVRVGPVAIAKPTVEHWMSVMARERASPRPQLRERALAFLISSQWILGEAAAEHMEVSDREVKRRLQQKQGESFRNGAMGFGEYLKDTGQTAADVRFRIEVELASAKIRRSLTSDEPKLSEAQIVAYYRRHARRYRTPERRYFDIDNLPSKAAAIKAKREIESSSGKSFARMTLRESLQRPAGAGGREVEKAVFAAKPDVLTGPVRVFNDYSLFEVRRIVPSKQVPLAQVRSSIERQLASARQQRTLAAFVRAWRSRWTLRTDCRPAFVVAKCRQYSKPAPPEDPLTLD
jgi:hypothetical protein